MSEQIRLENLTIFMQRRAVKHVYLRVHPPDGRVTLVAPTGT
ncbi:MAG: metal-dependent hydrolase, partial [Nitrosomonas sp. PRO5]|nr:metal-dependent hydrolase [Nitrosomonas sp. PRO5]